MYIAHSSVVQFTMLGCKRYALSLERVSKTYDFAIALGGS